MRVTAYEARVSGRPAWCHTRVQGLGVGGQVSNSVQLNLKSREISPLPDGFSEHFGSRAASSPLGQGQLWNRTVIKCGEGVVLDSASYKIGQSVKWAWGGAGRDAQRWPGDGARCPGATGGGDCGGLADRGRWRS